MLRFVFGFKSVVFKLIKKHKERTVRRSEEVEDVKGSAIRVLESHHPSTYQDYIAW